ncbi:MAG: PulJ/GspJ family protein [Planctomycetota bacterium]
MTGPRRRTVFQNSRVHQCAFTLVEILVAMAIFVALMLITTMAHSGLGRAADQAHQTLDIHARAAAFTAFMNDTLGRSARFAAIHRDQVGDVHRLSFMQSEHADTTGMSSRILRYDVYRDLYETTDSNAKYFDDSDLFWAQLRWERTGRIWLAQSRRPHWWHDRLEGMGDSRAKKRNTSHLVPTVQRAAANLIGGSGSPPASPGARLPLLREVAVPRDLFDPADWPRPAFDTAVRGDVDPIPGTYAVVNPDARSVNQDWANLVGGDDDPDYPDQAILQFTDVVLFEVVLQDRRGVTLTGEDNTLQDGNASRDWLGASPIGSEAPPATAPARARYAAVIHDVPMDVLDLDDEDGDSVVDEPWTQALAQRLDADSTFASDDERRAAFRQRLSERGYVGLHIQHVVPLAF